MLGLKPSHEGQDDFNILTICFKQKEGGISSHTLKGAGSIPKNSDESRFDPNGVRDRLLARRTKQVENSRNGETDVAASC